MEKAIKQEKLRCMKAECGPGKGFQSLQSIIIVRVIQV